MALAFALALIFLAPFSSEESRAQTPSGMAGWKVKSVPVPINDLAYDAVRNVVLGSVPGINPSLGNELVEFNAETGALGRHVWVGSDPGQIALSDDGSTAYVAMRGTNSIAKLDLSTFKVVQNISTGSHFHHGPLYAHDLEVAPGRTDLLAVSLEDRSNNFMGLGILSGGTLLPDRVEAPDYAASITFRDASTLYAYNDRTTTTFFEIAVNATGAHLQAQGDTAITGFFRGDVQYAGGLVYAGNGMVIDPSTRATVRQLPARGLLKVTAANERVTYVSDPPQYGASTVSVFNLLTGTQLDSHTFPQLDEEPTAITVSGNGMAVGTKTALFLLGPSAGGPAVNLPPSITSTVTNFRSLTLPYMVSPQLLNDPFRHRLYAATTTYSADRPNQLLALDPATGDILDALMLGSETQPSTGGRMAISDDGSLMYVGLSTGKIAMVALESFEFAGTPIELGLADNPDRGQLYAEDLEVMPGTTDTIAVALRNTYGSPWHEGIAVYKAGIKLPSKTASYSYGPNYVEFIDPGNLFGSDWTGQDSSLISVTPLGAAVTSKARHLAGGYYADIDFTDGLIYSNPSHVIDPKTMQKIGRFTGPDSYIWSGPRATEAVPAAKRAYSLTYSGHLLEFDLARYRFIESQSFPIEGFPNDLVHTTAGLAATVSSELVLFTPRAQPDPQPTPGPTPGPTPDPTPDPTPVPKSEALSWGSNVLGLLGNGDATSRLSPSQVAGLTDVAQLTAGLLHNVALKKDGTVWAWGWNAVGSVGDGTITDRDVPVQVQGLTDVVSISSGFLHNIAVKADGTVWVWGWNHFGQLGIGNDVQQLRPVQIPNMTNVRSVSAGPYHTLALKKDGTAWAWGWNGFQQLGDGTTVQRMVPRQVPGLTDVASVSAGGFHNFAIKSDGTVWGWGWNALGQLGDGTTIDRPLPHAIPGLNGMTKLSGGYLHSLGLNGSNDAFAWGWNYFGQLGDGTTIDRHSPVPLAGGTPKMNHISAGLLHSLATGNGELWAWGWNEYGELGDATTTDRIRPTKIGLTGAQMADIVAAGFLHSLAAVSHS